jgi:hypothetical protein
MYPPAVIVLSTWFWTGLGRKTRLAENLEMSFVIVRLVLSFLYHLRLQKIVYISLPCALD